MTAWPKTTPDYMLCIWRDIHDHCTNPDNTTSSLTCTHPSPCPLSEHSDCPFCNFQRRTPWYLCDNENQIVACEDLQPRQYSYRILVVGFGKDWHIPFDNLPTQKKQLLTRLTQAFAYYHCDIGLAHSFIKIDYEHSFPNHAHLHACMWSHADHQKFAKENPEVLKTSKGGK